MLKILTIIIVHNVLFFLYCITLVASADIDCKVIPEIKTRFLKCCPLYTDINNPEMTKVMQKCDADLQCDAITCAIKEFNVLDADGELDKDLMNKFAATLGNPDDVNDYLKEIADRCWKNSAKDPKCKYMVFAECFVNDATKNCTKSKIWNRNKIDDCNVMKQYMENCPINK